MAGNGEDCIMKSFVTCTLYQIYSYDEIKEDEVGTRCSTNGVDEECIENFGWKM